MLGMVEIPAKAGASAPYFGGVKALPFLTGFIWNQPAGILELF